MKLPFIYISQCVGVCNRRLWDHQLLSDGYFQGCEVYDIDYEMLINLNYEERPPVRHNNKMPCPYGVHYSTSGGQSLAQKVKKKQVYIH